MTGILEDDEDEEEAEEEEAEDPSVVWVVVRFVKIGSRSRSFPRSSDWGGRNELLPLSTCTSSIVCSSVCTRRLAAAAAWDWQCSKPNCSSCRNPFSSLLSRGCCCCCCCFCMRPCAFCSSASRITGVLANDACSTSVRTQSDRGKKPGLRFERKCNTCIGSRVPR